ncbi:MAG: hypothetical protein MJY78_04640 [Fibrobacter sp.]|nr:hypothetical protein [Fibrobacter sp.]
MKKMVRAVLFAMMAVFSTAVFAQKVPCAMPENLTEIEGVYQIGTCGDLYKFAEMVNGGETGINGMLTADIVVNVGVLTSDGTLSGTNFTQWTPIGTYEIPYAGVFDGDGHTISGLYFNDENVNYVGLFGYNGGNVQNVGVVDSYIRGAGTVGGVVGLNAGGTISNVYNTGAVSGDDDGVGGVVGWNAGGTISNVYNTGAVSGRGDGVGGVVGVVSNLGTVENAYYNTDFYKGSAVGECDGECEYENVEGKTTAELASTTLPAGFSGEIWNAGSGEPVVRNGKLLLELPGLKDVGTQPEIEYTGFQPNADGFYEISNDVELKCFAQLVNSGATSIRGRLTADICLNACGEGESVLKADGILNGDGSNFTQWTPIGTAEKPYAGTFDGKDAEGNAHVISGLYFSDEDVNYAGLFGCMVDDAKVQNVGVVDSYIRGAATAGGVVGNNGGTVRDVYNTGSVSGSGNDVGGVVGANYGTVSNAYNTGSVSGSGDDVGGVVGYNGGTVSNVYNTGAVSGGDNVGGVVGQNLFGTISNVYNTGAVSGTDRVGGVAGDNGGTSSNVYNVYNTGAVNGQIGVGGVVGRNMDATVSNVYNTGAVSGTDRVGGVVGFLSIGTVKNAYYNTDFYAGNALGENKSGNIENVDGKPTGELIAIDLGSAWVAGNLAYDKTAGILVASFPYLENLSVFQYKINLLEFKVVDNVIQIANADELKDFARLVNEFGVTDVDAKLTADICLNACGEGESVLKADGTLNGDGSNFMQWTPIGTAEKPYAGTFDGMDAEGNAHVISGLYFNDETADSVGLFGSIGENAQVQNVGVEDSYFRGGDYVGSVVGFCESGEVDNVYNTGIVEGENYVGGVAGYIDAGVVSNAYNTGSVSVTGNYVGGVVGGVDNKGSVSNVYNMGSVGGTRFTIGGVVGFDYSVTISNAYFNTDFFTGNALGSGDDVENVGGKTSAELAAGTDVVLDADFWVVGAVSENVKRDTLYYPYLKVFGPHKYELSDVKKYAITVVVNDKAMGTVTGAGEYEYGTTVKLSATANEGYKFTDWEDDVKTAARTITVTKAETYTANFEAISSSSSEVESSSSVAESSSSVDESSSSEAVSSSSSAKSSSSSAKSSSSEVKSSSSEAESSSSEAKSSSSDAKSSSSQKESIIAQAQLPQFSVTASGKMVSIAGARPNSIVNVFDMQGNMVKTVVATSANFTFALPSAGVYIVKNGYTAKRVNVR